MIWCCCDRRLHWSEGLSQLATVIGACLSCTSVSQMMIPEDFSPDSAEVLAEKRKAHKDACISRGVSVTEVHCSDGETTGSGVRLVVHTKDGSEPEGLAV